MSGLFPAFPAFLDLVGRSVVLLSGRAALAELARGALDAGASVRVYDPEPDPAVASLCPPARRIARRWRGADLRGAALVAAAADEGRPIRARRAAKVAGALFYQAGAPDHSDIALGAASLRGGLALGVAIAGAHPAVGEAVRRRLEAATPATFAGFLAAAAALEVELSARLGDAAGGFWGACAEAAVSAAPMDWPGWIRARLPNSDATSPDS